MAQALEERWQTQRIHAARDDRLRLRHALSLIVAAGTIRLVLLKHERNVLVRSIALHLSEAHGSDVDAAGADDAQNLVWTKAV